MSQHPRLEREITHSTSYDGKLMGEMRELLLKIGTQIIDPMIASRPNPGPVATLDRLANVLSVAIKIAAKEVARIAATESDDNDGLVLAVLGEGASQGVGSMVGEAWPLSLHEHVLRMITEQALRVATAEGEIHAALDSPPNSKH